MYHWYSNSWWLKFLFKDTVDEQLMLIIFMLKVDNGYDGECSEWTQENKD